MAKTYVLYDCDTGSDDAIALMILLSKSKECVPVALTCVEGNTHLSDVVMNNLRLLQLFDMLDKVPLYRGCNKPMVSVNELKHSHNIHGSDGMGGQPDYPPSVSNDLLKYVQEEHAVNAIINLSKKFAGSLKVVATGPLTNLAMAVRLDPSLPTRLAGLYIMGGSFSGVGNVTPAAEFNFHFDPEAAFVTLQEFSTRCPTHLLPFEFTLQHPLSFEQAEKWLDYDSFKASFAKMVLQPLYDWSKTHTPDELVICDAYAMAVALDPSIAGEPQEKKICIELGGHHSRGHVVVDHFGLSNSFFTVLVYDQFNIKKYYEMLLESVE